ncbi:MAG: hypothetical protein QS748_12775 [Candidatus Endonucleobacter bathymodioli]|uniref:Uncharacterized protein n=1 Tax=Candidatus Endonucleibacter bathymodioli TaxID=539814 RepID=A0AA90P0U4_9GAMM|nr:hypothetical protein [Candidatus Endonucleobacter bathymodioli]
MESESRQQSHAFKRGGYKQYSNPVSNGRYLFMNGIAILSIVALLAVSSYAHTDTDSDSGLDKVTDAYANSERVTSHEELQDALKDNHPPSGYIDLSTCNTEIVIGNMPDDDQTYRLSFNDHFSFNLKSKTITSIFDTVLNNSRTIKAKPVFIKVPATVFVSSFPQNDYLRYQITIDGEENDLIRVYHCPWKKSVYLWR